MQKMQTNKLLVWCIFTASGLYAHPVLAVRKKNDTLHFRPVLWLNGAYLEMWGQVNNNYEGSNFYVNYLLMEN